MFSYRIILSVDEATECHTGHEASSNSWFTLRLHVSFVLLNVSSFHLPSDLKNKWHLVVDRLTVLFLKFLEYFHKLQLFIWWLLEIHIIKLVSCYIVMVSLREVITRHVSAHRWCCSSRWYQHALQESFNKSN